MGPLGEPKQMDASIKHKLFFMIVIGNAKEEKVNTK